jgi:hypothetical protein
VNGRFDLGQGRETVGAAALGAIVMSPVAACVASGRPSGKGVVQMELVRRVISLLCAIGHS